MEFTEVIRTTFAVRDFVPSELPDSVLYRILEQARFAPSGGNRQGWKVVIVRDPEMRRKLADLARPPMQSYFAQARAGESPWNTIVPSKVSAETIAATRPNYPLLDQIADPRLVPAALVVAVDLSVVASFDKELSRIGVISGGSVYPFVWSILLAARNEGYGGVLTTFLAPGEAEVQRLLGLPAHFAVAAFLPLGKPQRQLTRLKRKPVEEFARLDRWEGGEPLRG
jgi:nitroreductase